MSVRPISEIRYSLDWMVSEAELHDFSVDRNDIRGQHAEILEAALDELAACREREAKLEEALRTVIEASALAVEPIFLLQQRGMDFGFGEDMGAAIRRASGVLRQNAALTKTEPSRPEQEEGKE